MSFNRADGGHEVCETAFGAHLHFQTHSTTKSEKKWCDDGEEKGENKYLCVHYIL